MVVMKQFLDLETKIGATGAQIAWVLKTGYGGRKWISS